MADTHEALETPTEAPKVAIPANVFEFPKFDMPKFEMPSAFRELAEKSIAMAKENYDKMKSSAEEATDVLEETYSTASQGCSGYGLKVIEAARTNSNAAFDLFGELLERASKSKLETGPWGLPRRLREEDGLGLLGALSRGLNQGRERLKGLTGDRRQI